MRGGLALALVLFAGCTCRNPQLEPVPSFVRVEPTQLDFGRVFVGQAAVHTVELINGGRATLEGQWTLTGSGFTTDDGVPSRAAPGSTSITLICAPDHVGLFDGTLRIALTGFEPIDVPLACEGIPVPQCVPTSSCRTSSWDLAAGRCVESPVMDGVGCELGDVCLLDATCRAGRCEGRARGCDDADPCTSDTCDPVLGCQHSFPARCPDEGPCRVGQCVPGQGCALVDAADGTPCGQLRTCTLADVCIAGACVQRDPPDGFVCSTGGPCEGDGRCVNDVCITGPKTTLSPRWSLGEPEPDGGPTFMWSDLLAGRDGLTTSSYFFTPPRLQADGPMPIDLSTNARRCISWLGWLVCGDAPAIANAPVSAFDPRTGTLVWTWNGTPALIAEFVGPGVEFFTARLAEISENELLVLYESRTITNGVDPRCRTFGMVVLDRQGQALRSKFINDPIFQTCDHPHSYGVATDAQGNVYLAFTPSAGDNPATSLTGTTIFSFTPALQQRWRVFATALKGGEISVGDGLLFTEHSDEARSTQTGLAVASMAAPFGLGVIGAGTFVGTQSNVQQLAGLSTATQQPLWRAALTGTTGRTPLTVAQWASPWGPRELVLAFTRDGAGRVLIEGTELLTGASAFSCEATLRELPTMTAMVDGGIGVVIPYDPMAPGCDDCDPRYARTRNSFSVLPLPGLSPSTSPWTTAWGDGRHSHHEGH